MEEPWDESIDKLLKQFDLPLWLYYGDTPRPPHDCHPWYALHLPQARLVQTLRQSPSVKDVQTLVPTLFQDSGWHNLELLDAPVHDVTVPKPDQVTRQLPGQTHAHFKADDEAIKAAYAKGTPEQIQLWDARRERYKSLECPTKEDKSKVFEWDSDLDGNKYRRFVGRKRWRAVFEESAKSQRWYNPVRHEFDICKDLDALAVTNAEFDLDEEMGFDFFPQPPMHSRPPSPRPPSPRPSSPRPSSP